MQFLRAESVLGINIDVPEIGVQGSKTAAFDFSQPKRGRRAQPVAQTPVGRFTPGELPQKLAYRPERLAIDPQLLSCVAYPGRPSEPLPFRVAIGAERAWALDVTLTSDFDGPAFPAQALSYRLPRDGAMQPYRSFSMLARNNRVPELATIGEGNAVLQGDVRLSVPPSVRLGTYRVVIVFSLFE